MPEITPEIEAVAKALYETEHFQQNLTWPPVSKDTTWKYLALASCAINAYNDALRKRA